MELHKIYDALKTPCDKGTEHSYIDFYEGLFTPFKRKRINLLEIGIDEGGSLLLWSEYFSKAKIYGVDNADNAMFLTNSEISSSHNITTTLGDATKEETFKGFPDKFNIIIDDGSHRLVEQIKTFEILFPRLKGHGLYVIEDVQSDNDAEELKKLNDSHVGIDLRYKMNRYDDYVLVFFNN